MATSVGLHRKEVPQNQNQTFPKETHVSVKVLTELGAGNGGSLGFHVFGAKYTRFGKPDAPLKCVLRMLKDGKNYYMTLNQSNLDTITALRLTPDALIGKTVYLAIDPTVTFNHVVTGGVRIVTVTETQAKLTPR